MIVSDLYNEAKEILGVCDQPTVFSRLTDALELLANKSQWEGLEGYVDILVDRESYVTLPRQVGTPLAVNVGGRPSIPRNQFFEFHLNGPGSLWPQSCRHWDYLGMVCTYREALSAYQVMATADRIEDIGKTLRIYGFDLNGERLVTEYPTGTITDGLVVVISQNIAPVSDSPFIGQIERIIKDETLGFVTLSSYIPDGAGTVEGTYELARYYPDETTPSYRRIRISSTSEWIRMRYRKAERKVTSLYDPIHLNSRMAVINMLNAVKIQMTGQPDAIQAAEPFEIKAVQQLSEEEISNNPLSTFQFQFDTRIHMADRRLQGIR